MYDVVVKQFTFAISSPDELLVVFIPEHVIVSGELKFGLLRFLVFLLKK